MHPQLELLLEIQDLKMQRRGLADGTLGAVESEVFAIRVEDAIGVLDEKVGELEERLSGAVRDRYHRIVTVVPRVVAPVLNGICYGCFVAIATARAVEAYRNDRVESCEYCGCFLYHLD